METRRKTVLIIALVVIAAAAIGALSFAQRPTEVTIISDIPSSPSVSSSDISAPDQEQADQPVPQVVGLSESAAISTLEDSGHTYRITSRDGQSFPVTADYNAQRVNLSVDNGEVTAYFLG